VARRNSFAQPDWIELGGGDVPPQRRTRQRRDTPPAHFPPMADDDQDETPQRSRRSRAGAGLRAVDDAVPDLKVPGPSLSVDDGAGFLFGLLLYTLALAYFRNGPQGVTSWLKAKLLNKPTLPRTAKIAPSSTTTSMAAGNPVRTA
jgi:hypothetical protein